MHPKRTFPGPAAFVTLDLTAEGRGLRVAVVRGVVLSVVVVTLDGTKRLLLTNGLLVVLLVVFLNGTGVVLLVVKTGLGVVVLCVVVVVVRVVVVLVVVLLVVVVVLLVVLAVVFGGISGCLTLITSFEMISVKPPSLAHRPGYDVEHDVPDGHFEQALPLLYISPPI